MAQVLKDLFGANKPTVNPIPAGDSDFGDFAGAPDPVPGAFTPVPAAPGSPGAAATLRPYSKWYNVHERHSLSEFKVEGGILACIAVVLVLHMIGARLNRTKARKWAQAHAVPIASEFAVVGFDGIPAPYADKSGDELAQALSGQQGDDILKEKSLFEFAAYATGRQNVAFLDAKLTLKKRFSPIMAFMETALGFFFESVTAPDDSMEAILYPFDGMEASVVPGIPGAAELKTKDNKSGFDGFVWAIVNKERMKQIRDDRYDLSITSTRDHAKLPVWLTTMTENAEITDIVLTPELIKAAESAGELLDYFIITDQPIEKPITLDDTKPRKRIFLRYSLPSDNNYEPLVPIFQYFMRISDALVKSAHFRPEVTRKLKLIREDNIKQIKKADEDEKAEERAAEREKIRKAKREQELNALDAKAQKKYLEKEREKELRKSMKKQTARG